MASSAETWDDIYQSGRAVRTWPSEDVVRFCARRLVAGASSVLEVGCGNGANLWFLTSQRFRTWGIDCSMEALNAALLVARIRDPEGEAWLKLSKGKMGELKANWPVWAASPFDAIIDCRASQHTPWSQHAAVYREYFDLLKPGGWLFLLHLDEQTSPDAQQPDNKTFDEHWTWDDIADGVYPHNGVVCMPPGWALRQEVIDAGLTVQRDERLTRAVGLTRCSHTAIDAQKLEG